MDFPAHSLGMDDLDWHLQPVPDRRQRLLSLSTADNSCTTSLSRLQHRSARGPKKATWAELPGLHMQLLDHLPGTLLFALMSPDRLGLLHWFPRRQYLISQFFLCHICEGNTTHLNLATYKPNYGWWSRKRCYTTVLHILNGSLITSEQPPQPCAS